MVYKPQQLEDQEPTRSHVASKAATDFLQLLHNLNNLLLLDGRIKQSLV